MSLRNKKEKAERKHLKIYYEAVKSTPEDTSEGDEFNYGDCFEENQARQLEKELGVNLHDIYHVGRQFNQKLGDARREWKQGDFDIHQMASKNDEAIERIICTASGILRSKGHTEDAKKLEEEHALYATAVSDICNDVVRTGIGDHRPLSEWLARVYDKLEQKLGTFVMEATRLKDLKIFNFCIPVVFNPKGDRKINPLTPWGLDEYLVHFVALAGSVAYWVSWAICAGITWGMGAISFLCNLPAMGIEKLVAAKIAPNLGKRIYLRANPNEIIPVAEIDFDYVFALI